jgi:hypothetical protein
MRDARNYHVDWYTLYFFFCHTQEALRSVSGLTVGKEVPVCCHRRWSTSSIEAFAVQFDYGNRQRMRRVVHLRKPVFVVCLTEILGEDDGVFVCR